MRRRVAFVPAAPLLLPEYAGIDDPAPDLRAACLEAATWLAKGADDGVVSVVAAPPDPANAARGVAVSAGQRVAEHLLAAVGLDGRPGAAADGLTESVLVLGNGTARRGERAPGHLDERSFGFDEELLRALSHGDPAALAELDEALGAELLADGVPGLRSVGRAVAGADVAATTLYADDPFGVQYWVVTWECSS